MKTLTKLALVASAFTLVGATAAVAQTASMPMKTGMAMGHNPMVGGAAMYANKTIVQNAVNSPIHTTLVAAVKAAGLVDTLNSAGPFTVFAPTDAAFKKLPAGTVDTLVKPESHDTLVKILTYHVVPGTMTAAMLTDGKTLTTVQGETLTVKKKMGATYIVDSKGGMAKVTTANVMQSNGVIHVVDSVLMP